MYRRRRQSTAVAAIFTFVVALLVADVAYPAGARAFGAVGPGAAAMRHQAPLLIPTPQNFAVQGVDTSHYEHGGPFNWWTLAHGGPHFISIKATEGLTITDPWFGTDITAARAAHMIRTAYHFFDPTEGGAAQAAHFLSVVHSYGLTGTHRYELPLVLDLEKIPNKGCGASARVIQTQVLAFIRQVERVSRPPIIYTQRNYVMQCMAGSTELGGYMLWLADYGEQTPPHVPGNSGWSFWQYSDSGQAPGINHVVDLNAFNGTYGQLKHLADLN
jgi:lysozyme